MFLRPIHESQGQTILPSTGKTWSWRAISNSPQSHATATGTQLQFLWVVLFCCWVKSFWDAMPYMLAFVGDVIGCFQTCLRGWVTDVEAHPFGLFRSFFADVLRKSNCVPPRKQTADHWNKQLIIEPLEFEKKLDQILCSGWCLCQETILRAYSTLFPRVSPAPWQVLAMSIFLSPRNLTWTQKWPYWKGTHTFAKPSFWVSTLVFGGVVCC